MGARSRSASSCPSPIRVPRRNPSNCRSAAPGARTRDGLAELAALDSDGDGFSGEADAVYAKLRIFRPGEVPTTLAQNDVGALSLARAGTELTLAAGPEAGGQLRSTGFHLRESGGAGTLQQVDLLA